MALYDIPNMTDGVDVALVEVVQTVPNFLIGLLLFIWGFVFIGGAIAQQRKMGFVDMPLWSDMASISTLLITLILSIKEGLINLDVLGIVVALTVMSGLWLFLSKGKGEV